MAATFLVDFQSLDAAKDQCRTLNVSDLKQKASRNGWNHKFIIDLQSEICGQSQMHSAPQITQKPKILQRSTPTALAYYGGPSKRAV